MLPKHVRYQAALHPARPGCRHRRWFCSRRRNISYYTCVHLSTPFFNFSEKTSPSSSHRPPALLSSRSIQRLPSQGSCPASSRTKGLPHGQGARGRARKSFSNLRTEPALRAAPVFRMAYSAPTAHCAVSSETLDLQVLFAHPPMPHRTSSSSCSGVSHGLFMISHHRPSCSGVPHGLFSLSHRLQNAG